MDFAERVINLQAEGAYYMMARAQALEAAGRQIIHLEIGQPDEPTFANIAGAGIRAIKDGYTRYTPSAGIPALRQAVAEDAGRRRGIPFNPSQVVIGPGAKPALFFPTLAIIRPGDEVIYPDPGFPTYTAMVEVAGGVPVPVPLREEQDFSFDLAAFDRLVNKRTRMVILNSPSNPTGGVMPRSALEHIAETANRQNIWVLSDEIYSRLVYETHAPSTFTQLAGLEAIRGPQDQVEMVVAEYQRRRDTLVAGLNAIPRVTCRAPQGAFYVFPNVSAFGKPVDWLAEYLLEEAGVALLPGTAFGRNGEGYLRLCFANSLENIQMAIEKMSVSLGKL
jgi:aspartate aminotransferase